MQRSGNPAPTAAGDAWVAAMRVGDDAMAWLIADAVLAARDPATRDDPRLPYHQRWVWDGRGLDGRDVLVRCYHGLGDTLMFARYLAPLRERAARVTLEAPPVLVPLLRRAPGVDLVVTFDPARPVEPAEVDVEIMELAHALRLGPLLPLPLGEGRGGGASDRDPVGREAPSPRPSLGGRGSRTSSHPSVGLCWAAGDWDRARSVPLHALLGAVGDAGPLVSLQRGPAAAEADRRFLNPADDDPAVERTAALIAGTRLVVTVDTMVAHLAGSLGVSTLLLLKHDPDWRWQHGEGVSRWYPSVTMARQAVPGDWSVPLAAVSRAAGG